ncbi:MAG: ribosome small subunit-dependent GTPase A [Corynebacterium sp.]|nr:ribosome small subunit-dependent GTPase A [Corynebacterium sp.]
MGRQWDESDVRIRPGKKSRPRTKDRPRHDDAIFGMVLTKDRGRWGVLLDDGKCITCMRAKELRRTSIEVGDRVGVVGDTSGSPGTLGRIVKLAERTSILRRTADDADPYERIVVANADLLLIVVAVADPPPRAGFVERALVAAYAGNLQPVLCLTKSDLGDPSVFAKQFAGLDIPIFCCGIHDELSELEDFLKDKVSACIGHSGVGKSTLVNRLIPDADRATGDVSGVGKGRHTSTQAVALALPQGGWIIDTPGIRSFGLAHITADQILAAFPDVAEISAHCPRGCTHHDDPTCALLAIDTDTELGKRAQSLIRILREKDRIPGWLQDRNHEAQP